MSTVIAFVPEEAAFFESPAKAALTVTLPAVEPFTVTELEPLEEREHDEAENVTLPEPD